MGLEAAKFTPKEKIIVISGRTVAKLENAVNELKELGFEAYAHACDTSKRESVKELAEYCASLGEIKNVINAAGVSPAMKGTQESILRINALGTVYVNQEFSKVMSKGSVIVDISSNSAYVLPSFLINKKVYALAETDEATFLKKLVKKSNLAKGEYQRKGFAYSLSLQELCRMVCTKMCLRIWQKRHKSRFFEPGTYRNRYGQPRKERGRNANSFLLRRKNGYA